MSNGYTYIDTLCLISVFCMLQTFEVVPLLNPLLVYSSNLYMLLYEVCEIRSIMYMVFVRLFN